MTATDAIGTVTAYDDRRTRVREAMDKLGCDAFVLATPENIHYLSGLDNQGHFAFTALMLPRDGEPRVVAREMERPTVVNQAVGCAFQGYADGDDPAAVAAAAVRTAGSVTRVGTELTSMCLPPLVWDSLRRRLPGVEWIDCSPRMSWIRAVKSPAEIACVRAAAGMSDAAVQAGIARAGEGVRQSEVAAECYHAMLRAGSEYPGFVPLIRSGEQLRQEHVTWTERPLRHGEALLIELSAAKQRYHAPLTRLVHIGAMTPGVEEIAKVALGAQEAVVEALRPGVLAEQVYQVWQAFVDNALGHGRYRRHHCGYLVGAGFPPSWVGGSVVHGLRPNTDLVVQAGMTFHLLSWILADGLPEYAISDTALVTDHGCDLLTTTPREPRIAQ
ncbi:MAG: aminopeptidase P family protein [Propionibacteriales bacterium]|nr:aminopeptidase P family protein [Propionibacteriales bacterium]